MVCSRICRLTVLLMIGISFVDGKEQHYNNVEHDMLCDLLKAAVGLWDKLESRNGALGKALAQAIFGTSDRVEDPTDLKLPSVYDDPDYRLDWCGGCDDQGGPYPGKSISHDLLCLCTVGGDGTPFSLGAETLCRRKPDELGCEGCSKPSRPGGGSGKGWDDKHNGKEQLRKTWSTVVTPCLKGGTKGDLKAVLGNFTQHLNSKNQLGGPGNNCGGSTTADLCVRYAHCGGEKGYPMWWKELEKAFEAEAAAEASLKSSASGSPVGQKGVGTSAASAGRPDTGKAHDREGAQEDSTTKNSPEVHPQPPIASESSKHSRETSNGGGGNTGYSRLLGTSKLSRLNWFLFSGLL